MRLLAVGQRPADFEEEGWIEKPGFPEVHGTWLHPLLEGLPQFEFEEGHEKTRNEPPFRLTIGTHEDAQMRLDHPAIPRRHCMIFKENRDWFVESLNPSQGIWLGEQQLELGVPARLRNGDHFSLLPPPTDMTYEIRFDDADNWYIDLQSDKEFPNKWPAKMPGHPTESPPAPEELKRLAWQTDQMRRRSEEDRVRVADWAAFAQYVKKHYHKYGIFAKPWKGSIGPPLQRPPPTGPRALPPWIADIVAREQLPPHVEREYPFRDLLELSGRASPSPTKAHAPLPLGPVSTWGAGDAHHFRSGGTGVMVGDSTVYAAMQKLSRQERDRTAWGDGQPLQQEQSTEHTGKFAPADEVTARHNGSGQVAAEATASPSGKVNARPLPKVTFREWLLGMEDSQFVAQYHDSIAAHFDSLEHLVDLYVSKGHLDDGFFQVAGIRKLGHKRIFQKWFRDYYAS